MMLPCVDRDISYDRRDPRVLPLAIGIKLSLCGAAAKASAPDRNARSRAAAIRAPRPILW